MTFLYEESSFGIFLLVTVILGGGAAWLAGRGVALSWKPWWKAALWMIPLGAAVRFIHYALFGGTLLSLHYYLVDTAVLLIATVVAHRVTRTGQMVRQYPWLYERAGPFGWRDRAATKS